MVSKIVNLKKRLVLTCALPYANGPLHLGHATEAIQADVFARHRRLYGQDVEFLCAVDAHGTATERAAKELGTTPQRYVADISKKQRASYAALDISFTHYGSSDGTANHERTLDFYEALNRDGHLVRKEVQQLFDNKAGEFLHDRRVRGECPRCGRKDQPGDNCECGATYEPKDLIDPVSTLTGERPTMATAEHLYFNIDPFQKDIRAWLNTAKVQPEVIAKLHEWLDEGLRPWCITRTGPYFGFKVPGEDNLFFYVWLDAPITYIATGTEKSVLYDDGRTWEDDWRNDDVEIVHIIGKDITNFHGLFWPALLLANGCRLPDRLHAHGFATIDGSKMSKSKGNFVLIDEALKAVDSEHLRYAICARLGSGVGDLDINAGAVVQGVNTELLGKVANIALRLRPFQQAMNSKLADTIKHQNGFEDELEAAFEVIDAFEEIDLARAVREIMAMADRTNREVDHAAPWKAAQADLPEICTEVLVKFRLIVALMQPICPLFAKRCLAIFGEEKVEWNNLAKPPLGAEIEIPSHLIDRVSIDDLHVLTSKKTRLQPEEEKQNDAVK